MPHAVELALASLPLDPKEYLAPRDEPAAEDLVSVVLAAGEEYRERLGRALWQLVRDSSVRPAHRWRAASRLESVAAADRGRAEQFLRGAGVWDPASGTVRPLPNQQQAAELRVAVAGAWLRIEGWLHENAPAVLAGLAGPASPAEIAAAELGLGCALPVDFAASCEVHRSVEIEGLLIDYVRHGDIAELAKWRDELLQEYDSGSNSPDDEIRRDQEWRRGWVALDTEGDGSSSVLDLDPGPDGDLGQLIYADQGSADRVLERSWLHVLLGFAEKLEAGRYRYDSAAVSLECQGG